MAKAYLIQDGGVTDEMARVRCINEDRELQLLLENNPNLLPGEQIDPDNPRRWVIIKREMPVPDFSNGSSRWSVDLLFSDQDAIPTFVECKRYLDTRSRREAIGQVFEYAANGHFYWSADELRRFAEEMLAKNKGLGLDDEIRKLQQQEGWTDAFFERLYNNLREAKVRIILFMEESPPELRSIVDFLNRQMERSEILIVEARQFQREGLKIVVPVLFGYTEEAKRVKRSVSVNTVGTRRQWDKKSFFDDARGRLAIGEVEALETIVEQSPALGYEIVWGISSGMASMGAFSIKAPQRCTRSLLTIKSNASEASSPIRAS